MPRIRNCEKPVKIECAVYSREGDIDCDRLKRKATGRLFDHGLKISECVPVKNNRVRFIFSGTVSTPRIAKRIKQSLRLKRTIGEFTC